MKTTKRHRKAIPSSPRSTAGVATRKYETKVDSKKRVVLRGARHTYYEVNEKANGSIVLTPKKLVDVEPISARSMAMIESSMANFKKGMVSEPIDLSALRKRFSSPAKAARIVGPKRKATRVSSRSKD